MKKRVKKWYFIENRFVDTGPWAWERVPIRPLKTLKRAQWALNGLVQRVKNKKYNDNHSYQIVCREELDRYVPERYEFQGEEYGDPERLVK